MEHQTNWARYWRSEHWPLEAMHAHFRRHAYDRHSHETYSFGVTLTGAQGFRCRGEHHTSSAGMVLAFNPDEPHDGHAAMDGGFTYQIVHIGPELVAEVLAEEPAGLPLFTEPVLYDPVLAEAVRGLGATLLGEDHSLAHAEALQRTVSAMVRRGTPRGTVRPTSDTLADQGLRRVRDLLHASFTEHLTADHLAEVSGRSRFAVHRAFTAAYGLSPGEYQRQLRLRYARRLLATGSTPAGAAGVAGFADQSHLHRWFRRHYGITPTTYRRGRSPLNAA